jgi:hypothetical protein
MKSILLAAALLSMGDTVVYAAEPASAARTTSAPQAPAAAAAAPLPESAIEIFRIAPGQHESFLKMLAETEAAMAQAGLQPDQLYIHEDGASWDFILVKIKGQDPKKWQAAADILHKQGHPSGPDYFFTIRKMIAEHTDTTAIGPTTATAYLATRKAN